MCWLRRGLQPVAHDELCQLRGIGDIECDCQRRMVEMLVDGLRYRASTRIDKSLKRDARRNRKAPAK
jgi:hypothetical protein